MFGRKISAFNKDVYDDVLNVGLRSLNLLT
jgi:hypothetical protein